MNSMQTVLKQYFGFSSFRPYQDEVIQKIIDGRDSLIVMATGSGKSLCYQVPPLVVGKTGVVVSPLISLMQDQVMSLKQRGVRAEYIGSSQTDKTVQSRAESGQFDILYMTPEKACGISVSFWSNLLRARICLFAVDEAHCISEWGHDFRVEYKQLDKLRGILVGVPFIGLTATATETVRMDIVNSLKLENPYVKIGSFDRGNLFYGVKLFNRSQSFIHELVQEVSKFVRTDGSTIIYCTTIKDVNQVFNSLVEVGIKAGIYHGQMTNKARAESHRLFIRDELDVMVATIAFGMGIDKPNIRQVIHYGCPKSLESYYQESGRCGRDGMASVCWLYYTRSDFTKADFYAGECQTESQRRAVVESLMAAQQYCLSTTCRRKFLLGHFGEIFPSDKCGNCDNCISSKERDMSREAFLLMACIQSCRRSWGLNMHVDILRGSRAEKILDAQYDKLPLHGLGKDYSSNWWKALSHQLISSGYLVEKVSDIYRTVSVGRKGEQFLNSAGPDHQPPLVLPVTSEMEDDEANKSTSGEVGEIKGVSPVEFEGFSEQKLTDHLVSSCKTNLIESSQKLICNNEREPEEEEAQHSALEKRVDHLADVCRELLNENAELRKDNSKLKKNFRQLSMMFTNNQARLERFEEEMKNLRMNNTIPDKNDNVEQKLVENVEIGGEDSLAVTKEPASAIDKSIDIDTESGAEGRSEKNDVQDTSVLEHELNDAMTVVDNIVHTLVEEMQTPPPPKKDEATVVSVKPSFEAENIVQNNEEEMHTPAPPAQVENQELTMLSPDAQWMKDFDVVMSHLNQGPNPGPNPDPNPLESPTPEIFEMTLKQSEEHQKRKKEETLKKAEEERKNEEAANPGMAKGTNSKTP